MVIVETLSSNSFTWKGLSYVPKNLHPTIKWSAQQPYPLEAEVQDVSWQIVNQNEHLDSNLDNLMIKVSNSFTTAKESVPLLHKITKPTSTKRKADNQNELHAIKKLKISHNSSKYVIKQKK
jgi:hypothetical protein